MERGQSCLYFFLTLPERDPLLDRPADEPAREAPDDPLDELPLEETPLDDPEREVATRLDFPPPRLRVILPRNDPEREAPLSPEILARLMHRDVG